MTPHIPQPSDETRDLSPAQPVSPGAEREGPPAGTPSAGNYPPGTPLVPPPERIGRFEIRRTLGEGAFGRVYLAFDPQLERLVALKVAKPEALSTPERVRPFIEEAKAVANLRHTNVVQVYDSGVDDGRYYIASAFLPGGTLEDELHRASEAAKGRSGLPLRRAAGAVRKLAEALAYSHSRGVVHRDVKPANVMLDETGEPLLADFGLAARAGSAVAHGGAGTPQYMAPEQWAGQSVAASDQYALGCTLYKLITGEAPFGDTAPAQQEYLHVHQPPEPPRALNPSVPRDLQAVCLRALAKQPAGRYADCQEMADDLRRWLDGEPVHARRAGPVERLVRWARRKPSAAALAAALVALLVGSVAAAFWYDRAEQKRAANRAIADLDLDVATESLRRDDREGARRALGRAKGRLEAAGADSLRPRYDRLEDQIAFAQELDDIRDQSLLFTGAEPAIGAGKPPPRAASNGVVVAPVGAKYAAAFARRGWAVGERGAGEIAQEIDDSPVRTKIVEALYHWFGNDAQRRPAVEEVLRLVTAPDTFLHDLRQHIAHGTDSDRDPPFDAMSAHELRCALLLLQNTGSTPPKLSANPPTQQRGARIATELCYRAREAYPDDYHFNLFAAGASLIARPPRPEEALGFARVALALRPQSAAALYLNGWILSEGQKNPRAAISYFTRAVAIDPAYAGAHTALAIAHERTGDYPAALRSHRTAIELDPNTAVLHSNLASTLHKSGDSVGAIAATRRAIELAPNFATAHNNLGMSLRANGETAEAIRCLRRAIELEPEDPLYHFNLGSALRGSDLDGSIRSYRRAVELEPSYAIAHNNLGSALGAKCDRAGAVRAHERAVELEPQNPGYRSNFGAALVATGKTAAGLAECRRAVELAPNDPVYRNGLGDALAAAGDYPGAVAAFEKAVALDGSFTDARINLGVAHLRAGRPERSAEVLRAVVAKEPSSARARYNLAAALAAQKNWQGAVAELTVSSRLDPTFAPAFNDLGFAYRKLGKFDEAKKAYERAAEADKSFAPPLINLGDLLLQLGDLDGAVRACRAAVAADPNSVEAYNNLAAALAGKKEPAEAIAACKRASELAPTNAQVHRNLASLYLGAGDKTRARAAFRRAVELDPHHVESQLALAFGHIETKEYERAVEVLRAAVAVTPDHAPYYSVLGHALTKLGKIDDAVTAYRDGIRADPRNVGLRTGLAMCLMMKGDFAGAIDANREVVRLEPENGDAWFNIGSWCLRLGRFEEAVRAFEKADEHGSAGPNKKFPPEPLARAKALLALDAGLDDIVSGKKKPRDADEAAEYAALCHNYKKRYALAAKLFATAFDSSPKLAARYRFDAALAAIRAAARSGTDAADLTAPEVTKLRDQSLAWLNAELEVWRADVAAGGKTAESAQKVLKLLTELPDFAGVRDPKSLDELPAEQARGWKAFWKAVGENLPPPK